MKSTTTWSKLKPNMTCESSPFFKWRSSLDCRLPHTRRSTAVHTRWPCCVSVRQSPWRCAWNAGGDRRLLPRSPQDWSEEKRMMISFALGHLCYLSKKRKIFSEICELLLPQGSPTNVTSSNIQYFLAKKLFIGLHKSMMAAGECFSQVRVSAQVVMSAAEEDWWHG